MFKNGSSIVMALGLHVLAFICAGWHLQVASDVSCAHALELFLGELAFRFANIACYSMLQASGGRRSAWKPSAARHLAHGRTPALALHGVMLLLLAIIQQLCGRLRL